MIEGRYFFDDEFQKRERVAILGMTVVKELFEDRKAVGKYIKLNSQRFLVIGVLKEKGSSGFQDNDDVILIPLSTAMKRLLNKDHLDYIKVTTKDKIDPDLVEKDLNVFINHLKKTNEEENSYKVRNMASFKDALSSTTKIMSFLLSIIAAISLIVGGIGIMNIMMVTITERTKEIGLRKAIGAGPKAIMIQFLIESIIISLTGGVAGILFGVFISVVLSLLSGWNTRITFMSIFISTFFSILIGIIFGIWPARKASKLRPIDALRYE